MDGQRTEPRALKVELVGAEIGPGGLHASRDGVDVADEQSARLSQLHSSTPSAAIEQPNAQVRLERGNVLAHGRLGVIEGFGCLVEGSRSGDGPETQQVLQFDVGEVISVHDF